MKKIILVSVLSLSFLGCSQAPPPPEPTATPRVSVHVEETKAAPEATPETTTTATPASADVHIDVNGVKIEAHGENGEHADVKVTTDGATVETGADKSSDGSLHIQGANGSRTVKCNGENVKVEGYSNHVVLTGKVGRLTLAGAQNTVDVQNVTNIDVSGADNHVQWSGEKPAIEMTGLNNKIEKKP